MQVDMRPMFTVGLTRQELRIIGLALAQKLKRHEDIEEAAALNKVLLGMQEQKAREFHDVAKGALKGLDKASEGE